MIDVETEKAEFNYELFRLRAEIDKVLFRQLVRKWEIVETQDAIDDVFEKFKR